MHRKYILPACAKVRGGTELPDQENKNLISLVTARAARKGLHAAAGFYSVSQATTGLASDGVGKEEKESAESSRMNWTDQAVCHTRKVFNSWKPPRAARSSACTLSRDAICES